ncbi:pyrimidine reductase family protein [Micromonospora sp. RTGN7]|uniref:pyrimidine reductase family protein n=1 Tax=Micromonospora sp. RTGN7 TaxID=3016526 RepID=UPI0029FF0508|nr:pyrimidine reductase family protein [Micromonospora sp. RTGN7]
MSAGTPISRLWPGPAATPLDDAELAALYGRADGPHLRVNFVTSVDGAVTLDGYSAGLSGQPDKRVFGLLRMLCDALVVAAGTLRHEGYRAVRLGEPRRAWRRTHGLAEYPTLVVVSGSLELDPAQAAFADAPVRPVVLTHAAAAAPPGLAEVADLVRCGTDRVNLAAGLVELRRRGLGQLLCEGGPHLFGALTAADLVDEVCLTVAPLLAGAGPGRITAGDASVPRELPLRHVLAAADGALMLRYARDAEPTPGTRANGLSGEGDPPR